VVCKFGSRDPATAAAGVQLLLYETEVAFYRELAPTVDVARPHCYFAGLSPGTAESVVVLEDLSPAEQGDQIGGCSLAQATLAVEQAARLHGPRWGDPALGTLGWLVRAGGGLEAAMPFVWGTFVDRFGTALDPVTVDAGKVLVELGIATEPAPHHATPTHADFRLDNMLFASHAGGRPIAVVDWQTVQLGSGPRDVAYFLGSAFAPEVRRSCERTLVARYHRTLVEEYAVHDYPFEECWADYVANGYASLLMAVFASVVVRPTERGDAMFMAMANRSAQMAADLDTALVLRTR
jgi:hypothetical protein